MRDRSLRLALAASALLVATLAFVGGAPPASAGGPLPVLIVVQTTDDSVAADGLLSLREAVSLSNSNGTVDVIRLQEDETYQLDRCAGVGDEDEDANTNGDLDLLDGERIVIEGEDATIVAACEDERVFDKLGTGELVLEDVTITGGSPDGNGGGVLAAGELTVRGSRVQDSTAFQGGGIWAGGPVELIDSAVADSSSLSGGGGIYGDSTVQVVRSSISGNESSSGGGGIFAQDDVSLVNATITGNMASNNGGVSVSGQAFISHSTLVANGSRDGFGGANLNTNIGSTVFASVIALGGNGDDCDGGGNPGITSFGFNVGSDGSCGFTNVTDRSGVYPHLVTAPQPAAVGVAHPPVEPSLAIDLDPLPCDLDEDQAEDVRPVGPGCDAGSIEVVANPCVVGFGDVGVAHPFFEEICWMDQTRISTGFPGDLFKPSAPVTRQAMAAFIYRLAMEPPFELAAQPSFNDVGTNHPFFVEIEWMADRGISTGFDGDLYLPAANVSRQAMSAFMYRVAGEPLFVPQGQAFTDVSPAHPFYDEIEWMADEGIADGFMPGPTYRPGIAVSRQAMSAFMLRLAEGPELTGL